ncbi:low temperature requirement protein A [Spelaeicoccus albus]
MVPRRRDEPGRGATPLELLFDLVFVVAVSQASSGLHAAIAHGHSGPGIVGYLMAFFAIWWAWMNFTWFASAYDTDDWLYRITTIVQMGGALVLAAGIPGFLAVEHRTFTLGVLGYVVMRLSMIFQWLRAAHDHRDARPTTLRYAVGIAMAQAYWVLILLLPGSITLIPFLIGAIIELSVPVIAERHGQTNWHPGHIADRYSCFTIIVLGESILASTHTVVEAFGSPGHGPELIVLAATALVVIACLWWVYFALPQQHLLVRLSVALRWGYLHALIFACVAAVSAGIEVLVDFDAGSDLSRTAAQAALCLPVAIYAFLVWVIIVRPQSARWVNIAVPIGALLLAAASLAPFGVQFAALILAALAGMLTRFGGRRPHQSPAQTPPA